MRYVVIDRSTSGHCCCFEFTILDTYNTAEPFPEGNPVCECFEKQAAELVCAALNEKENNYGNN